MHLLLCQRCSLSFQPMQRQAHSCHLLVVSLPAKNLQTLSQYPSVTLPVFCHQTKPKQANRLIASKSIWTYGRTCTKGTNWVGLERWDSIWRVRQPWSSAITALTFLPSTWELRSVWKVIRLAVVNTRVERLPPPEFGLWGVFFFWH